MDVLGLLLEALFVEGAYFDPAADAIVLELVYFCNFEIWLFLSTFILL